jgi:uncharacterized membrane protein YbhN (UPF0104 family)
VRPPMAQGGSWLKWVAGLTLGGLFTWFSARSWPIDRLFGGTLHLGRDASGHAAVLLQAPGGAVNWSVALWSLAAYSLCLFVIHWLRVLRWRPLLQPYADVPVAELNRAGAIGFAAVFLLPLRLGEFVRPWLLARPQPRGDTVPFGAGLGSIAIERILDGLMVTAILFTVLMEVHPATLARNPEVEYGAYAALAVFGVALGGLLATLVARDFTLRMTRLILGSVSKTLADKVIGLVTAFLDGLAVLQSPWAIAQFIGLTVVYWGMNGLGIWLFARGFGLDVPVVAAYAMMSCVVVGMMIPNSPGNVGSFWYFLLLPAGLYAVKPDSPRTIAFALALWFAQTVQVTLFGLWGWWAEGRARRHMPSSPADPLPKP